MKEQIKCSWLSISLFSYYCQLYDCSLTLIVSESSAAKDKLPKLLSSITPIELYISTELKITINANTRESCVPVCFVFPPPSESRKTIFLFFCRSTQIQMPYVNGSVVFPILNFYLSNNWFSKYDFPVRYIPAIEITTKGSFKLFNIFIPSSVSIHFCVFESCVFKT